MILVTGGAGFIGSNLLAGLEARGQTEVAVCDRLGDGDKWRNIAKREIAAFVQPERLAHFLDSQRDAIETVFHLGAVSSTTETDADLIVDSNFTLSLFLWDWCAKHNKRLIYASSAATYGDGSAGFDDDGALAHLARLKPLNAYGWSKNAFDRRVARIVAGNGARPRQWAGVKFFNVYGPNEYHKGSMASVVYHTHARIKRGEKGRLFRSHNPNYADGGQLRDFVWVGDCVDVMLWLHDNPAAEGLFNSGSGKARSFLDLTHAVFRAMGREPRIEWVDTPAEIRARYQYFTEARIDRLRKAGYKKPTTSLEDGVATYVRDFLEAADPYR
ncbi:MAG: ADP-glyceromanno-heptose 6-epimerase [Alphaproteobacteria bacterium]|nr:ADP-glyceromanno-heptose 6-epimerase [Alphaproteobacteria bacterium]